MKKMQKALFFLFLFTGILFLSGCPDNNSSNGNRKCGDFDSISFDEYILENNTWGKGSLTNYSQCIFWNDSDSPFPLGWEWEWPVGDWNVKAYPEIIFGHKPWSSSSTSPELPLQVLNVSSISVSYDYSTSASGMYNMAIEFWLTSSAVPASDTITTEVMIWLDNNGMYPAGSNLGDVIIDGEGYSFYAGSVNTGDWLYIAFVKNTAEFQGETKIDAFIDFLSTEINPENSLPYISTTDYVASIEMGNELIHGSGTTTFVSYSIVF